MSPNIQNVSIGYHNELEETSERDFNYVFFGFIYFTQENFTIT